MDRPGKGPGAERYALIPLLGFGVSAVILLLIGHLLFDNLRDGIRREVQHNISLVGSLKANQIRDWLDDRYSDANSLADDSFFAREAGRWMRTRDAALRMRLVGRLQAFLEGHHFHSIVLYDVNGRELLSVGAAVADLERMGEDARRVAHSGLPAMIDLHRHRDESLPIELGFISPLREGPAILGSVFLAEDPERYLFPLIHEWPGGAERAETQLVRVEGRDVLFLDKLNHRPEPAMGFRLPLDTPQLAAAVALRGKRGVMEHVRDYRGKEVLAYSTAIAGTPWVLISKIDEEEAYRLVDQMRRATGMLALLFFALIGAWFWQWLKRGQAAADAAVLKERLRADALQMEGDRRFRSVFEHTALAMARKALTGEYVEVNDAWCELFGYSRQEVYASRLGWRQLTDPEDVEAEERLSARLLAGEIEKYSLEKRYRRKDGKLLWCSLESSLVRDEHGEPEYFINAMQDITERKQAEQQISFLAYHDRLTGLPNRALLYDRLSQAMSQAKRDAKHVALLFIDLDGFKAINDQHGHEAGDAVLKMAAQRLLACVRAVDTVARFGGDEFAVVLGNLDGAQQARVIAEKIVQAFGQSLTLPDGLECHVGTSVGISIYPDHGGAMDSLLTAADQAMYDSKHGGKSRYTFFDEKQLPGVIEPWIRFEQSHLLGIEEIDEQHRNLVYLVNRLNEALHRSESDDAIAQMFDELLVATRHHFETESRYMRNYHYPEQNGHELEHAHLVNEAVHFRGQLDQGRELLALQSVKDWLLSHISYSDRRLAAYLRARGVR